MWQCDALQLETARRRTSLSGLFFTNPIMHQPAKLTILQPPLAHSAPIYQISAKSNDPWLSY